MKQDLQHTVLSAVLDVGAGVFKWRPSHMTQFLIVRSVKAETLRVLFVLAVTINVPTRQNNQNDKEKLCCASCPHCYTVMYLTAVFGWDVGHVVSASLMNSQSSSGRTTRHSNNGLEKTNLIGCLHFKQYFCSLILTTTQTLGFSLPSIFLQYKQSVWRKQESMEPVFP